jgi:hypothetical protein
MALVFAEFASEDVAQVALPESGVEAEQRHAAS